MIDTQQMWPSQMHSSTLLISTYKSLAIARVLCLLSNTCHALVRINLDVCSVNNNMDGEAGTVVTSIIYEKLCTDFHNIQISY